MNIPINNKLFFLLLFYNGFSSAMEDLQDDLSQETLYALENPEHRAQQVVFRALQQEKQSQKEKTEQEKEKREKEFIALIENPFDKSEEETLKKLEQLLQHVDPHKERCSMYEMIGFTPLKYLLYQSAIATEEQKYRIEKMIFMINDHSTDYLYSRNPV